MKRKKFYICIVILILTVSTAFGQWWNPKWHFRVPVTVNGNGAERIDRTVVVKVDFGALLGKLGQSGTVDRNSIRVVEVDGSGKIVNDKVPFQFDKFVDFKAFSSDNVGELVFYMAGTLGASAKRMFHVYFDTKNAGIAAPSVEKLVELKEDGIKWPTGDSKAQASVYVTNKMGRYYFHKQGGAFASVIDKGNNDWVKWKGKGGWGGNYRGLMNSWGPYHPGYTDCTTKLVFTGPVRTRIQVNDNTFVWDFYPTYIRATRLKGGQKDWWYEGVPGGEIDAGDSWVASNGTERKLSGATYNEFVKLERTLSSALSRTYK